MYDPGRMKARELARRHVEGGDPLGWFEVLYLEASGDPATIPWADLSPNPGLIRWLDRRGLVGSGAKALKVGCGLGDDAQHLSCHGLDTTAFDISSTAIAWCRSRFPGSPVRYMQADLLGPPDEWSGAFDLVVESYTLQVLPAPLRREAARRIGGFVAPGGTLLVIARARESGEPEGEMPWPLTRDEMRLFEAAGLEELEFEDYVDDENPPVRRFMATYTKPQAS